MADQFTLTFQGDPHEIDAVTLGHSLLDVAKLVQAAAAETAPGVKADVKVTAHEPGSFEVQFILSLLADTPGGLWGDAVKIVTDSANVTLQIIGSLAGAIGLYRLLKGEAPKAVTPVAPPESAEDDQAADIDPVPPAQSVEITAPNNTTITINQLIVNLYNSEDFQKSAPHLFETLDENEAVKGVRIEQGPTLEAPDRERRLLVEVPRAEFPQLTAAPAPILLPSAGDELQNIRVVRREGMLPLLRVHFHRGHQWSFLYEGFDVSGTVEDESFWQRFDAHEITVGVGDTFEAVFEFTQRRDPQKLAYVTDKRSFKVLQVRDVIPPARQRRLPEHGP